MITRRKLMNDHGDWLYATAMDGLVPDDGRPHPFAGATPQPLISTWLRALGTMWERWDHDTADPTMTGESEWRPGGR